MISYTCAPRGNNISSSAIASELRKTNLDVAASCLAIKEAGHYDARIVAGQRLQREERRIEDCNAFQLCREVSFQVASMSLL